uniref:ASH domain-containing protein n=1 Tax=Panagrellus redivivus TaxID=6233 RepID=A0A7E4ZVD0_PANRE
MATAQEIENEAHNVSILSDCFEEDDDDWGDSDATIQPARSAIYDRKKHKSSPTPLDEIAEETGIFSRPSDYGQNVIRDLTRLEMPPRKSLRSQPKSNGLASPASKHSDDSGYRSTKNITTSSKSKRESLHTADENISICSTPKKSRVTPNRNLVIEDGNDSDPTLTNAAIGRMVENINLADDSADAVMRLFSNDVPPKSRDFTKPTNYADFNALEKEPGHVPATQRQSYHGIEYARAVSNTEKLKKINQTLDEMDLYRRMEQKTGSPKPSIAHVPVNRTKIDKTVTAADPNRLIAVKPYPLSNFGCVGIDQSAVLKVTIANLSKYRIRVHGELKDGVFSLLGKSTVTINAYEQHEFLVEFSPVERARYRGNLMLRVNSSNEDTYSHALLGFGGAPNMKIFTNQFMQICSAFNYIMTPPSLSSFTFDVANYGERTGFVFVMPVDDADNVIPGVSVTPDMCLLLSNEDSKSCKEKWEHTITVEVSSDTLQTLCRRSRSDLFKLKIVSGVERLRQRAKKYILQNNANHPMTHGIPATELNFFDDEAATLQKNNDAYITEQDVTALQDQIRVTTIRVCDPRLPRKPKPSVPEGFYIATKPPNDFKYRASLSADRTIMASASKKW